MRLRQKHTDSKRQINKENTINTVFVINMICFYKICFGFCCIVVLVCVSVLYHCFVLFLLNYMSTYHKTKKTHSLVLYYTKIYIYKNIYIIIWKNLLFDNLNINFYIFLDRTLKHKYMKKMNLSYLSYKTSIWR